MKPWAAGYVGGAEAIKYAIRDLPNLDRAVALTRGKTAAVQAGANFGVYPKRLAETFATVYCFEPAPDCFAALQRNVQEPNVVKLQAAVGYQRHTVGLSRARRDGKPNAHEGITYVDGEGVFPVLRIDDLALPACDLIALDVEGGEFEALMGASRTIGHCRPVLLIEINKNLNYIGLNKEDVRGYIRSWHYRFVERLASDEIFVPAEWGDA